MILAFDTATDQLTVALGDADGDVAHFHEPAARAHLGRLLPTIDSLLVRAGRARSEIDLIAVGIGPGSFTGLRIGVATAQALAHGLNVPLAGIPTLDTLARGTACEAGDSGAGLSPQTRIYPILDAKRGEIYTSAHNSTGDPLDDPRVVTPQTLAAELENLVNPIVITGDGLDQYHQLFSALDSRSIEFSPEQLWVPDARVLIQLAKERMKETDFKPYFEVLPIYTRLSDAEEKLKRDA